MNKRNSIFYVIWLDFDQISGFQTYPAGYIYTVLHAESESEVKKGRIQRLGAKI